MVRKLLRIVAVFLFATGLIALLLLLLAYRAMQQVPDFYEEALAERPIAEQQLAGNQLEQEVLQLSNNVQAEGVWEACFTDEELNGWLAVDLPEKFAQALPSGVSDPRVAIEPEMIQVACQYQDQRMNSVISVALDARLTEEPNVVAIHIRQARAGWLPLPFKKVLERITQASLEAGIPIEWTEHDGETVALVTVPKQHAGYRFSVIHLDTVELRKGELYVAGRTEAKPSNQSHKSSGLPNRTLQRAAFVGK